jgi:hypothetical protein
MLTPGVDFVAFAGASAQTGVTADAKSTRVQPLAGARLAGALRVSRFMALFLGAGLDVDFAPRRWVVLGQTGPRQVFELARYRPYAFLGADLTLFSGRSKP